MRRGPVTDFGGKSVARQLAVLCIDMTGGANIAFISRATGLPKNLLLPILRELRDEGLLENNNIVWRIK